MFLDVFVEQFSDWEHLLSMSCGTQAFGVNGNISVAWMLYIKDEDCAYLKKIQAWQKFTYLRPCLHNALPNDLH